MKSANSAETNTFHAPLARLAAHRVAHKGSTELLPNSYRGADDNNLPHFARRSMRLRSEVSVSFTIGLNENVHTAEIEHLTRNNAEHVPTLHAREIREDIGNTYCTEERYGFHCTE